MNCWRSSIFLKKHWRRRGKWEIWNWNWNGKCKRPGWFQVGKDADDSDDSLLEELATVAVKEGSDSDENLSDVEELNHKDETSATAALVAAAAVAGSPTTSPSSPPTSLTAAALHVYEHNPGEVYPIAEEEEEAASPTASDGVTSLRRRARLNSG